ncbi:MAG TPA: hypothetical protein VFW96_21995 [Thermomicrobiales bacterium]|nr:hypothetical protein [Thermomicrobiales bacterium]
MYAIVRESTYDVAKLAQAGAQLAEFQNLHAARPGYRGNVVVDAGEGRRLTVTLWETEDQAAAARAALEPKIRRLLGPLQAGPSRVIGVGGVVATDLALA